LRYAGLVTFGLLTARPALACGACTDQEIRVWLPFAGPVMALCLLWAASVLIARKVLARRGVDAPRVASPFHQARRLFLLGIPVCIGLVVLTMGSLLGPALVIGGVWVVLAAVSTAKLRGRRERGGEERAPTEAERTPRMERLVDRPVLPPGAASVALALNGIFLALAIVAVPVSYIHSRSTARMISLLSYPSSGTQTVLLPGLIAKGDSAVQPLIDASRRAVARDGGAAKGWVLSGTLHCLGSIGGAESEGFLEEVVRDSVDFADSMDDRWQKAACLAYAECAGRRAAPLLVQVHKRSAGAADRDARGSVIEALRLADPEAAAELIREKD
jgi:hypothetical protein